jgi:hypothetical protein|tara:strand:- start:200 stop:409 length:210 start_codon:yes stop_codon:yes gene_type:complete
MMTNPAAKAYAAIGNAEPKKAKPVEQSSGLLSRSKNFKSTEAVTEKEPKDLIIEYVGQIRGLRKELRNG